MPVLKTAAAARIGAEREASRGRKLQSVHSIRNYRDVLAMKILVEKCGSPVGDGSERDVRMGVDAAFQTGKKRVINAAMEAAKQTGFEMLRLFVAGELREAMEKSVNNDHV